MPKFISNKTYRNWGRNLSFRPERYYTIKNEEEIIEVIQEAKRANKKIRVVGTGHSWSALIKTDAYLLNMDAFNRVLNLDKEKATLTVQSGAKLWEINNFLAKQGFALANLGSIDEQSIAGAIATGTHGTGTQFKTLADQLQAFTLIDANGQKHIIDREADAEKFNTSVVHLGALGIVATLKLKVVQAFQLHETTELVDFDLLCKNYHEIINSADHVKFWWFPSATKIMVYRYHRTNEKPNDSRLRQWFLDEFISVYAYRFLVSIGNINRNWRPKLNNIVSNYFLQAVNRIEQSYKVYKVASPPIHRESEWAFDIEKGAELLLAYRKMLVDKGHKINFLQEIRFVKGDDFALSPSYKRASIWLGVYLIGNKGWDELLADFEDLAIKYNGRPHWGKESNCDSRYLQKSYPNWAAFKALKNEMDPNGFFENSLLKKIFPQDYSK